MSSWTKFELWKWRDFWWFFTEFYSFRQNIPPIRHHSFLILTELQTYGKIQSVYVEFSPTTPLIDNHSHLARLDNDNYSHLRQRHFSPYFLHISTYFNIILSISTYTYIIRHFIYIVLHISTLFDISPTNICIYRQTFYILLQCSTYSDNSQQYRYILRQFTYKYLHISP